MNTFHIVSRATGRSSEAAIEPGLSLAQHLFLHGAFAGRPLCSGAGRCGLCRVRFLSEPPVPSVQDERLVPRDKLTQGWRLACRRAPVPGSRVEARLGVDTPPTPLPGNLDREAILGIDLGTTSVQWRFDQPGERLEGSFRNPQLGAGSEVMSRLAMARVPSGADRLRLVVAEAVRGVLAGLPSLPGRVCLAGNTCMTYLALGFDVSGLASAPYRVDWPGGTEGVLDEGLPGVYIPPLLAPFVGGDVSAGLAALEFSPDRPEPPFLLADLGTNGEFALALPGGEFLVASVPMGPALEGVGMSGGMLAGPGAAVAFGLAPSGLAPVPFGGAGGTVRGVSGTGYLSLVARLRSIGVLDETGRFRRDAASPLAARVLSVLAEVDGEPALPLAGPPMPGPDGDEPGLLLRASDVEALLKVKAAFCVAVKVLLDAAGLDFAGLSALLLAGALGEHVNTADLEALGFFPPGGAARVRAVGNTSLDGACLAASRGNVRDWLARLPGRTRLVDVVSRDGFQKLYIDSMRFTHVR